MCGSQPGESHKNHCLTVANSFKLLPRPVFSFIGFFFSLICEPGRENAGKEEYLVSNDLSI